MPKRKIPTQQLSKYPLPLWLTLLGLFALLISKWVGAFAVGDATTVSYFFLGNPVTGQVYFLNILMASIILLLVSAIFMAPKPLIPEKLTYLLLLLVFTMLMFSFAVYLV